MQADPYTRAILTFIALCLLVLVAQGFGVGEPEAPPPDPAADRGLWTLQMIRTGIGGPPTLLRVNTATGEVWQIRFAPNQEWQRVGELEEGASPASAAPPPAPSAPVEPPAPAPQDAPQP